VATDAIKNSLLAFWDIASGAEIAVRGLYVAYLKLQEVRTGDKEYTKAIAEQKANISALSAEIASHWTAAGMMAATNYVGGLQDQMKKKPPPAPKPPKAQGADEDWSAKMTEDVQKLTEAIAKDIVTMGMSADELARWELAQAGIPAVVIENVKAFQEQRAAMRWEDNADKTVRELTDAIAEDIVTMAMSTDEIQRWRAAQKGATEAQLDNLKVFQRQRAEQSFDKKLDEDVRKLTESLAEQIVTAGMSAEQLTAWKIAQQGADEATVENIRTLAEQAESAKFAAQTKEDILTPAEIYQRQMDKLWKAVELGQLTIEQFNKAKKKLEDPIIAKIEMQGVSAAIEGSREAAEAILRHRKKLADANATILPFGQSDQAEKGAAAIGAGVKWAQAAAAGVAGTVSGWFQGNGVAAEQPSGEQQVQVAATLPDSVVDLWSKALAALERIAQQTDREPVELTEVDSLGG
jgi:ketosteroid isomerase-like protein